MGKQGTIKSGVIGLWADVGVCLLLVSILVAHVVRDPSPWTEPFYSGARFDGHAGLAALFSEASHGRRVDHLLWPGLPVVAMGGMVARAPHVQSDPIESPEALYQTLDRINRAANSLGILGVWLLVTLTYFLIRELLRSRLIAAVMALWLAVSQSAVTQLGWTRSEVWSLAFLAAALLVISPSITRWLRAEPGLLTPWWRGLAFGALLGSALLSKSNIIPGIGAAGILFLTVSISNPVGPSHGWPARWKVVTVLLPVALFPWWALQPPSPEFFHRVSHYDRVTVLALSNSQWVASMVTLALVVTLPALLLGASRLLGALPQPPQRLNAQLESLSPTLATVLTGGILSFFGWIGLLSGNLEVLGAHTRHVLSTLIATSHRVGPYFKTDPSIETAVEYLVSAGQKLGKPTGADLAAPLGFPTDGLAWLNPTTVGIGLPILAASFLLASGGGGRPVERRHTALALGSAVLLISSECLSAVRGEFLDFRYYVYAHWFACVGAGAAGSALLGMLGGHHLTRPMGRVAGFALVLILAFYGLALGPPTANQNAKFGRQIDVARLTAPSFFRTHGYEPQVEDWKLLLDHWREVEFETAFVRAMRREGSPFLVRVTQAGGAQVDTGKAAPSEYLEYFFPLPIAEGDIPPDCSLLVVYAEIELGHGAASSQPYFGLKVSDEGPDRRQPRRSVHSSTWHPTQGWVSYAVAVAPRGEASTARIYLGWQPNFPLDDFTIRNVRVGWKE